jgi:hypothetical protein
VAVSPDCPVISHTIKVVRALGVAAVLGAGFGTIVSLVNDLSSPYGELGGRLVGQVGDHRRGGGAAVDAPTGVRPEPR